jgi:hypothetical protein
MGSLALLPAGQIVAGPLAGAFGARVVLGVGGAIGLGLLALTLLPRSTRTLPGCSRSDYPYPRRSRARSA